MDNVTDFYSQMIADLPSQFKGKARIEGFIYAFSRQLNAVSDLYSELNGQRSLMTAVGKQLDGIGNIAVLTRDEATLLALRSSTFTQMTDDIYRLYLLQKIMANITNCTYYDIYNAMLILWGRTPICYSENIDEPATITITIPDSSSIEEVNSLLGLWEIRPAGVQLNIFFTITNETHLYLGVALNEYTREAHIMGAQGQLDQYSTLYAIEIYLDQTAEAHIMGTQDGINTYYGTLFREKAAETNIIGNERVDMLYGTLVYERSNERHTAREESN